MPNFEGSSIEAYLADGGESPSQKEELARSTSGGHRRISVGAHGHVPRSRSGAARISEKRNRRSCYWLGAKPQAPTPFADEYEVDQPEIEARVPCLVMDADSSQFSALVDIGEGKNLAIEGPPGTGKSQTIVNAIGAALSEGKKVLFVAEKLAALNVVKARLEAVGLGEFLLPLQAEKSTREQVMESIRTRLDMRDSRAVRDYDEKLDEFRRIRKQLADYIGLMTTEFGESGLYGPYHFG